MRRRWQVRRGRGGRAVCACCAASACCPPGTRPPRRRPAAAAAAGGGYLANVPPSQFTAHYEGALPQTLGGAAFLAAHGPHLDAVTTVDAGATYAVRTPTAHPVHECFRVQAFRQVCVSRAVCVWVGV